MSKCLYYSTNIQTIAISKLQISNFSISDVDGIFSIKIYKVFSSKEALMYSPLGGQQSRYCFDKSMSYQATRNVVYHPGALLCQCRLIYIWLASTQIDLLAGRPTDRPTNALYFRIISLSSYAAYIKFLMAYNVFIIYQGVCIYRRLFALLLLIYFVFAFSILHNGNYSQIIHV